MKVAIVHDWLTNMGGAEQVVIELKKVFPDAPIYTTVYNPNNLASELRNIDVRTSFLQKKKKAINNHQKYFPFMPMAFESFNLNEYDVVISSSSSCAHGIVTNPDTLHICYCHTPMRYAWEFYYEYTKSMKNIKKKFIKYFMNYMRIWDNVSSNRVDYFIANAHNVKKRINKHYRREADVIYPPIRTDMFNISNNDQDYYLVLSRLVPYKKIEIAVEACTKLNKKLYVIGSGPQMSSLKKIAGKQVEFLGRVSDDEIPKYYAECKAFLFPGEEDFGITPLEAQSAGRPVIAYKKGGALETIVENETGIFFNEQTAESLMDAIKRFETMSFDKEKIRKHALKFSDKRFKEEIKTYVLKKYQEHKN
ncbi:glycosyltransferase [Acholeplasma sp. OttesenSCG-928-E16]|nr:glycosyltransferase [Acholeplasma sp. OttesenSCG-928-E16]